MEAIVHKARSFEEAEEWDVQQHISMTPRERMAAARELQIRVLGQRRPDIRRCQEQDEKKP